MLLYYLSASSEYTLFNIIAVEGVEEREETTLAAYDYYFDVIEGDNTDAILLSLTRFLAESVLAFALV